LANRYVRRSGHTPAAAGHCQPGAGRGHDRHRAGGYELCERCLFEYKFYRRLRIAEGLFKRTGEFYKFWHSTVKAAHRVDKIPVLVARQNFFPTLLVCPADCEVFPGEPVLQLCRWRASVYNFDEVTAVRRKLRRRG
jgi:hypothetical protein